MYYNALLASQNGWHEGEDDPVPFIKYLLGTVLASICLALFWQLTETSKIGLR